MAETHREKFQHRVAGVVVQAEKTAVMEHSDIWRIGIFPYPVQCSQFGKVPVQFRNVISGIIANHIAFEPVYFFRCERSAAGRGFGNGAAALYRFKNFRFD